MIFSQKHYNTIIGLLTANNQLLQKLLTLEQKMSAAFDALTAQVTQQETVEASMETLLAGLSAQVAGLIGPDGAPPTVAQINALAQKITTDTASMTAAVVANTPPATPPAPTVSGT